MLFPEICSITPNKRIKLNEQSTFQHSKIDKKTKPSFLLKLDKGALGKSKMKDNNIQKVEISQFQLPLQYRSSHQEEFIEQENEMDESQMKKIMLTKKMTYVHPQMTEFNIQSLSLYRNNSTFQPAPQAQQIKLGDNVYLRSISTTQNKMSKNNNKIINKDLTALRINQDYEIQQNLDQHNRNHQNYICLNKLERIFYYVKKVKMDWGHQNYQFLRQMAENQIRIYTHDPKGYFIRYYQSWFEHNALYLTYEVAIESLEECNRVHKKLREVEVWNLLRDCCSSLEWLYKSQGQHHLNLKPGNIMKCHQKYKLSDPFLTTKLLQHYIKQQNNWSGYHYLSPQIKEYYPLIQGLDLSKSDIYSLSLCIIQNLLGQNHLPKENKNMRQYIQKHLNGYSPSLIKTLLKMISLNPNNRPKPQQIASFKNKRSHQQKQQRMRRFTI